MEKRKALPGLYTGYVFGLITGRALLSSPDGVSVIEEQQFQLDDALTVVRGWSDMKSWLEQRALGPDSLTAALLVVWKGDDLPDIGSSWSIENDLPNISLKRRRERSRGGGGEHFSKVLHGTLGNGITREMWTQ
ncbi:hypothetical protein AOLI_G00048960 [Acnodon oligacanthus]